MVLKKLYIQSELETKTLLLNKFLFTKTKRSKSSKKIPEKVAILPVIHLGHLRPSLQQCRVKSMVSEDEERKILTNTIAESLTTFTVFLRITLTRIAIDKITLYSTTSNWLTVSNSILNILTWHCGMKKKKIKSLHVG